MADATMEILELLSQHAHSAVRLDTAGRLGVVGESVIGTLQAMAHDSDPQVREAANRALDDLYLALKPSSKGGRS